MPRRRTRRRDPGIFPKQEALPLPPLRLQRQVGAVGVFHEVPLIFLARMNVAGLRPTDDVLDIGCGCGRVARYLCDYLEDSARYEGFDVLANGIAWCRENITPVHPNFAFTTTPLRNTAFSPNPALPDAAAFRFPYDDDSFDFACAQSVFTHLAPDTAENYLRETARVLRPGGTSCTTWFWFDEDGYTHPFTEPMQRDETGTSAVLDPSSPETAIAYRGDVVRKMHHDAGLVVEEPLHRGYRLQDLCIAKKP
jgi:ubiquinone/menaquinone biosynthesis C-methylase UbiE